jgi:teichuronic acid exporter
MNPQKVIRNLRDKVSNQFVRNLGWFGGGEIAIRVCRLAATIFLARHLSQHDYGLAAVVQSTNEFAQVFVRLGISAKLIQAEESQLAELAISAYWLNWVVYTALFVLQCLAAFPISWFYHNDSEVILPICAMAIVYLTVPVAHVQSSLIQRENRLKITALIYTLQICADSILSAVFALWGYGIWAIVLPKILIAPIWIVINYFNHPWRPTKGFTTKRWRELFGFGHNVLGVELLKTVRNNLDYLLVGRLIGVKELGIYYLAFSGGLGISLSVINAISTSLFPHLCEVRANWQQFQQRYFHSLKVISLTIVPVVLLQSCLAPFYVPILFGQEWVQAGAVPILILICLSAIPRPFSDAASQVLLATDKPRLDLYWGFAFTLVFAVGIWIGTNWGILGVASSVVLTHWLFLPIFVLWTTRQTFWVKTKVASDHQIP